MNCWYMHKNICNYYTSATSNCYGRVTAWIKSTIWAKNIQFFVDSLKIAFKKQTNKEIYEVQVPPKIRCNFQLQLWRFGCVRHLLASSSCLKHRSRGDNELRSILLLSCRNVQSLWQCNFLRGVESLPF